jgi:hypothetical protein
MDDKDTENDNNDWFTICDERNINLEKNNNNDYKISFTIDSKRGEDTVLNVLKNGQLFELLSALNPDVIDKINVTEHDDIHSVFMTLKNGNQADSEDSDKIINVYFSLKYIFKENKCTVMSQNENENSNHECHSDIKKKYGKDLLHVSKIKLKVIEKSKKTSVCITFKMDVKKSNNIKNMYIGLYFKKIFYRFKQYFE